MIEEHENVIIKQASEEPKKNGAGRRRTAGANGFFPDPIPAQLSGIYLLGEGTGYRSTEIMVQPPKFGDTSMTAVQWINKAVENAQNTGMSHQILLNKFTTGAWLGATAKLKQQNYMRNNTMLFKAQVTTKEEWVENNTIALSDYII